MNMFHVSTCRLSDYLNIITLRDRVFSQMPNKDWYYPSSNQEILEYLLIENHFICGVWVDEQLIGFSTIYEYTKDNYCIEDTVVHSNYRGLGLQREMWKYIKTKLMARNATLWCTIHPSNHYSLNNAYYLGFKTIEKKVLYNNYERYILTCELTTYNNT